VRPGVKGTITSNPAFLAAWNKVMNLDRFDLA
jgi:catalase (peroxidase I)